jgi:hypothetical protein
MQTREVISPGHLFTVRTIDKEKQPLPPMELLELRWHLSRIAAMQGGRRSALKHIFLSSVTVP